MMKKIKYGIIGLGFFGEKHAEVLSGMPDVELAGICTRRQNRLSEISKRFNIPYATCDYREILSNPDIEAVSIVTHVDKHKDIAIEALRLGKHVFLEKPMAGSIKDCKAILNAFNLGAGKFMVGHICRFDPRVFAVRKAIKDGRIGRIISMLATRNLPANIGAEVLDKISPIMGDAIHDIDIMLWLTGQKIKSIFAQTARVRDYKYPDAGWTMCRFDDGAVGITETVWSLPESTPFAIDARMEIIGSDGALYIDSGNAGVMINDEKGIAYPDTAYWPEIFGRRLGALFYELRYFVDRIRNDEIIEAILPEESLNAVAVACAAEKSIKYNCPVEPEYD